MKSPDGKIVITVEDGNHLNYSVKFRGKQVIATSATNYLNSVAVAVLKVLPAVWDETRVLPGSEIGELSLFARRSGEQSFIGEINDPMPRRGKIPLIFLGKGQYKLVEVADSLDWKVRSEDTLIAPLRKDGGYAAWLNPIKSDKENPKLIW